jgi:hypothetical protein
LLEDDDLALQVGQVREVAPLPAGQ